MTFREAWRKSGVNAADVVQWLLTLGVAVQMIRGDWLAVGALALAGLYVERYWNH